MRFLFFQFLSALAHSSTFFDLRPQKNLKPLFSLAAVDSDATDAEVEDKLGFQLEALSKQVRGEA
jgi:hypothetical protein